MKRASILKVQARKLPVSFLRHPGLRIDSWDSRNLPLRVSPFVAEFVRLGVQNLFEGTEIKGCFSVVVNDRNPNQ